MKEDFDDDPRHTNFRNPVNGSTFPLARDGSLPAVLTQLFRHIHEQNIRISDLAKLSGHAETTIYNWIRGSKRPPFHGIIDLANALGFNLKLERTSDDQER